MEERNGGSKHHEGSSKRRKRQRDLVDEVLCGATAEQVSNARSHVVTTANASCTQRPTRTRPDTVVRHDAQVVHRRAECGVCRACAACLSVGEISRVDAACLAPIVQRVIDP
jgi:hypothetical protein